MEINNYINNNKKNYTEKDYETLLRYQNSKLFIYQYSNEPIIRPVTTTQEYYKSFEQNQILNKTSKILSSVSNILSTQSIEGNNYNNNNRSFINIQHNLKKNFLKKNVTEKEYEIESLQYKYSEFLKSKKLEKLLNDEEFKQLCIFIESKNFDINMRKSKNIARWVLSHEYLKYHSKGEEIRKKYLKVLCPNYIYNENENNNEFNNENNNEDYISGNEESESNSNNNNNYNNNNSDYDNDNYSYNYNDIEINEEEKEDYNNDNNNIYNNRTERDCD
jgi:hypothetical protein